MFGVCIVCVGLFSGWVRCRWRVCIVYVVDVCFVLLLSLRVSVCLFCCYVFVVRGLCCVLVAVCVC